MHRCQGLGLGGIFWKDTIQPSTKATRGRILGFWVSLLFTVSAVRYVTWYVGCGEAHRVQSLAGLGSSSRTIHCLVTLDKFLKLSTVPFLHLGNDNINFDFTKCMHFLLCYKSPYI